MITPLTLPAATGGNGAITYTLTGATLPAGLTFDGTARTITGTAGTAASAQTFTYTAMDADDDTATLSIRITVDTMADTAPTFGDATDDARTYTAGLMITPLTLPFATGGNGAITYTLTGPASAALSQAVPGLTFTASTRVLSGAPTTVAAATDLTYTAGDTDGSAAGTDEVSLMFSITIEANTGVTSIPNQNYLEDSAPRQRPRHLFAGG